jgi:pyruvate/2-oxoglutarate/acetoin dehydrogenase E1 component
MYRFTEEQLNNSFAEAFAHRISKNCFKYLDAPVETMGALDTPAVPINLGSGKRNASMLKSFPENRRNAEILIQIK